MQITLAKLKRAVTDPAYLPYVARSKLDRLRGYREDRRRRNGYAPPPHTVVLFLTDLCNLRCSFCAQWGPEGIMHGRPTQMMEFPIVERVIRELAEWNPGAHLILMGGEPLLHPRWPDAVRLARDAGLEVTIITNGTPLEARARDAASSRPNRLSVSIDGPRDVHDAVRGEGAFDKVVRGIRAVADERDRAGHEEPRITVSATICETTWRFLADLANLLAELPVDELSLQHLYFMTPGQRRAQAEIQEKEMGIPLLTMDGIPEGPGDIDPDALVEELRKIRSMDLPYPVRFHPDYPLEDLVSYYGDPEGYRRTTPPRCRFIWEITTIYPDGRVTPCLSFPAGLVGEESLRDIWNSPGYRNFRAWCERRGRLPACHRCCNP